MNYLELLDILRANAEKGFAEFQKRLIFTQREILGVRTPTLRKLAQIYRKNIKEIFAFPNEYYEVVFIKLTIVSSLDYEEFLHYLDECVALMDNWALCDCFKGKCIKKHKDEFLSVLERIFERGGEYEQRYPLVVLLSEYAEEKYLSVIQDFLRRADTKPYYTYMGAAWLFAEVLIKEYDYGVMLLKKQITDKRTHNKAIQKALESYRLNKEQKERLRSLKIK